MKKILTRITEIIDGRNAMKFSITGYNLVETKLTIHYADGIEVFTFKDYAGKIEESYFKESREDSLERVLQFKELHAKKF